MDHLTFISFFIVLTCFVLIVFFIAQLRIFFYQKIIFIGLTILGIVAFFCLYPQIYRIPKNSQRDPLFIALIKFEEVFKREAPGEKFFDYAFIILQRTSLDDQSSITYEMAANRLIYAYKRIGKKGKSIQVYNLLFQDRGDIGISYSPYYIDRLDAEVSKLLIKGEVDKAIDFVKNNFFPPLVVQIKIAEIYIGQGNKEKALLILNQTYDVIKSSQNLSLERKFLSDVVYLLINCEEYERAMTIIKEDLQNYSEGLQGSVVAFIKKERIEEAFAVLQLMQPTSYLAESLIAIGNYYQDKTIYLLSEKEKIINEVIQ